MALYQPLFRGSATLREGALRENKGNCDKRMEFVRNMGAALEQISSRKADRIPQGLLESAANDCDPRLAQVLANANYSNLMQVGVEVSKLLIRHNIFFSAISGPEDMRFGYGDIGQIANIDGIDFIFLSSVQGRIPRSQSFSLVMYNEYMGIQAKQVVFYPEGEDLALDESAGLYKMVSERKLGDLSPILKKI